MPPRARGRRGGFGGVPRGGASQFGSDRLLGKRRGGPDDLGANENDL
jgi:hypothetical protein